MAALYLGLARIAEPFAPPILRRRGEGETLRDERLGRGPIEPAAVWWHAASVGEVGALEPVLSRATEHAIAPSFAVTTTTATGRSAAQKAWGARASLAPLDLPGPVARTLDARRPRDIVLVETELWPLWLREALRRGIRISTINARVSDRSWPRYRRWRGLFQPLLEAFTAVAARTERDAERFLALGARSDVVKVTGNTKVDRIGAVAEPARLPWNEDPVWVVGSMRPGEDAALFDAFVALRKTYPKLRLVLALRHPGDWNDLEARLQSMRLSSERRSAPRNGSPDVLIVDTHGELPALYAAADVAFVGGTLVPVGGHNVLEAAAAGVPVIVGPHVQNVAEEVEALEKSGGAMRVTSVKDLTEAIDALLRDAGRREATGRSAKAAVLALRGASDRALDWLLSRGAFGGA